MHTTLLLARTTGKPINNDKVFMYDGIENHRNCIEYCYNSPNADSTIPDVKNRAISLHKLKVDTQKLKT